MTTYIGNAFSLEGPALGSLRLVRGTVQSCMDPDDARPGLLVQEYDDWLNSAGREVEGWRTVCPLTDAHFMVDNAPVRWVRRQRGAARHDRARPARDAGRRTGGAGL